MIRFIISDVTTGMKAGSIIIGDFSTWSIAFAKVENEFNFKNENFLSRKERYLLFKTRSFFEFKK